MYTGGGGSAAAAAAGAAPEIEHKQDAGHCAEIIIVRVRDPQVNYKTGVDV